MTALQHAGAVWLERADVFFCMENKIFPWILLRQSDRLLQKFSRAEWKAMKPSGRISECVESNWCWSKREVQL